MRLQRLSRSTILSALILTMGILLMTAPRGCQTGQMSPTQQAALQASLTDAQTKLATQTAQNQRDLADAGARLLAAQAALAAATSPAQTTAAQIAQSAAQADQAKAQQGTILLAKLQALIATGQTQVAVSQNPQNGGIDVVPQALGLLGPALNATGYGALITGGLGLAASLFKNLQQAKANTAGQSTIDQLAAGFNQLATTHPDQPHVSTVLSVMSADAVKAVDNTPAPSAPAVAAAAAKLA